MQRYLFNHELLSRLKNSLLVGKGRRRFKQIQSQQALVNHLQLEQRILLSVSDLEPNDGVATAGNFGNLTNITTPQSVFGSISASDTMDIYKFTVDRNRQVQIQLQHLNGRVLLKISKDNDGDQLLRNSEELESLTAVGDFSTTESLSPGTYFVTILRDNTSSRTDYKLQVQVSDIPDSQLRDPGSRTTAALNLGVLSTTPFSRTEVVSAFDNDYYSFNLNVASNVLIKINGVDEDLQMILSQDTNNDNVLEVLEQVKVSNSLQTIEALGPGRYFLVIRSVNTAYATNNDNTDYQIQLSATALPPYNDAGGTLATSTELFAWASPRQDMLIGTDTDMYRFTVEVTGEITIRINGVTEPIQVFLGQDTNNNGLFDDAEILDTRNTSIPTVITRQLDPGTYYVYLRTAGTMTNTAYQISLEDNLPPSIILSSQTVSENANVGTVVGTFSAIDPEGNPALTYTLVSGAGATDNARFEIVGNQLRTRQRFDYETSQRHSIRVRVTTASGLNIEDVFIISVLDVPPESDWIAVGELNGGIPVKDSAEGQGYLMHSQQNVFTRFGKAVGSGNADHFLAVQFFNGKWQFAYNDGWVNFTPVATDRLIAQLDFSLDTASLLTTQNGLIYGIQVGIEGGDLKITPNRWYGNYNKSEFGLSGTYFIPGRTSNTLGNVRHGVVGNDDATGVGYIMYSQQIVHERFLGLLEAGNADHLVAVQFINGLWYFSDNFQWVNFVPESSDRLLARVNYDDDTVFLLRGNHPQYEGINAGFAYSDISIRPNYWNYQSNPGEFGVTGTYWN